MTLKLLLNFNLELNLENMVQTNPFLDVAIGDFNAKSSNWFCHDKTNFEGDAIENLTPQFGLHQAIKEPTHILDTSSLCIDLIFTSQPNLITESGVHSSLHSNCHHSIIFAKFNLEIVYPYLMCGRFGTIKMLITNSLGEQLMKSIGKGPF